MTALSGCSSIYSVGHSLGGAVASLYATCAGSGNVLFENTLLFKNTKAVEKLYTFGAPAVAYVTPLRPPSGGCFGGARFYSAASCDRTWGVILTAANK
mmetsp:Transcript_7045/g.12843  ORF Transcript_7045/g.12843 Transcript_7045/m.12843 type:complete len:98 (+) Transcript_7045:118-411(+)